MRVLIADEDPAFCSFVIHALEGSEFEAIVTQDPAELTAPNAIVIAGGPWIALALGIGSSTQSILVVVDDGDERGLQRALRSGADDAMFKSLPPSALLARLSVARHRLTSNSTSRSARQCLDEALSAGRTGAVMIRGRELNGAIHVHQGCIAWAERNGHRKSLTALLQDAGITIDPETSNAVLREAHETKRHFTEILTSWRVVDHATAREAVRAYLAREVNELLAASPASAMFAPYDAWRASGLSFTAEEILIPESAASGVIPVLTLGGARRPRMSSGALGILVSCRQLAGCVGATLVDRSGWRLGSDGEELDSQFTWSLVNTMLPSQRLITLEDAHRVLFARPVTDGVLIATFSLRDVNVGMARSSFLACCTQAENTHALVPHTHEPHTFDEARSA